MTMEKEVNYEEEEGRCRASKVIISEIRGGGRTPAVRMAVPASQSSPPPRQFSRALQRGSVAMNVSSGGGGNRRTVRTLHCGINNQKNCSSSCTSSSVTSPTQSAILIIQKDNKHHHLKDSTPNGRPYQPSPPPFKCSTLASRWSSSSTGRPTAAILDLHRIPSTTHGHEFHNGLSRVVMVRKTEQRTFASGKNGEQPKFETVTRETVETYRGNRTQRVTTSEKRDVLEKLPGEFLEKLNTAEDSPQRPSSRLQVHGTPTKTPIRNGTAKDTKSRSPSTSPDRPAVNGKQKEGKFSILKGKTKSETDIGAEGDFVMDCLRAHNEYREKHGVQPLKLNKKMCKYSEEWAKHLATKGVLEHRQNSEYGENIFCIWSSNPNHKITGREPVDNWYSEIKDHPFGREPSTLKSGHFSQVVWRDSKELGVAVAKSRTGQIFVVANYSPPGNFIGSFADNVPPVGGFPNTSSTSKSATPKKSPSAKTTSVESLPDDDEFASEGLQVHNEYRRKHGVPDLKLSKELCNYAKEWATTLAKEDRFGHRPDGKYGENIYCMWSSDAQQKVTAKDACQSWYKEMKDYTFGVEPKSLKSGHFTQMIWKSSQELGMGMARSKNGRTLIVANYYPRGNYIGQFVENVPRPR